MNAISTRLEPSTLLTGGEWQVASRSARDVPPTHMKSVRHEAGLFIDCFTAYIAIYSRIDFSCLPFTRNSTRRRSTRRNSLACHFTRMGFSLSPFSSGRNCVSAHHTRITASPHRASGNSAAHRHYISTLPGKAGERHVFAVDVATTLATCLTCNRDALCLYNQAKFSEASSFFALECLGPGVPRVELRRARDNQLCE